MDGRIARLVCTAAVVAPAGDARQSGALAEGMLRTELPAALPGALEGVLADDPTVYVARSLRCEVTTGPAATGTSLARSIATMVASAVRDPDRDGSGLVRFPSAADYLAAFLAALARGDAWQRWYFHPLRRFAHRDPPAVFRALHTEQGNAMGEVLMALNRSGELSLVLSAVGEEALADTWPSSPRPRPRQAEWLSLVRLALDLARALGWDTAEHQDLGAVAAGLAEGAGADLDWTDPVGLARALARAARVVATPASVGREVSAGRLPSWLDWVDADALVRGLGAEDPPPPAPLPVPAAPAAAARPSRRRAIEAILAGLVSRGATVLEPGRRTTSSVALWAALVEQMPELAEADWVPEAVRQFVDRHVGGPATHPGPAPVAAAGAGVPGRQGAANIPCAGVYLLLRTLDALRVPELCRRAGVHAGSLLPMLAWRWAGPAVGSAEVASALRPVLGDPAAPLTPLTAGGLRGLQAELARTVATQHRAGTGVVRLRDVPFGAAAMALIIGDADDLMWPTGQVRGAGDASGALLDWWREATGGHPARVEHLAGDADDPGRALLLASLAAVAHAHSGDPEVDLPLDLIALTVLREWARWLRGFSDASLPYLLTTFVRRPGRLTEAGGVLHVDLDGLPHDVVLDISGCLAAVEPVWPWAPPPAASGTAAAGAAAPGGGQVRRIEFTVGA